MQPLTAAQKKMVEQNLRLVPYALHKYVPKQIHRTNEWDDLYQIGCIGLMRAAATFDADRGIRFSTYATKCILVSIRMHLRSKSAGKRGGGTQTVSMDKAVHLSSGNTVSVGNLVPDRHSDVESSYCASSIHNFLLSQAQSNPNTASVIPVVLGQQSQRQVADRLGCNQSNVSRRVAVLRQKVQKFQGEE